jgi:hypothetical protein
MVCPVCDGPGPRLGESELDEEEEDEENGTIECDEEEDEEEVLPLSMVDNSASPC